MAARNIFFISLLFPLEWLLTLARGCNSAISTPTATTSDSVILNSRRNVTFNRKWHANYIMILNVIP